MNRKNRKSMSASSVEGGEDDDVRSYRVSEADQQQLRSEFGEGGWGAYTQLQRLSQQLNAAVEPPRIAVVGGRGSGKTALLSALAGVVLPTSPARVRFEHQPTQASRRHRTERGGLVVVEDAHVLSAEYVEVVADEAVQHEALLADGRTHILLVEPLHLARDSPGQAAVRRFDPHLRRTTVVYTRLGRALHSPSNCSALFAAAPPQTPVFYVTAPLPSAESAPSVQHLALQALARDRHLLADYPDLHPRLGLPALARHLERQTWQLVRESLPEGLRRLDAVRRHAEAEKHGLMARQAGLGTPALRTSAASYVREVVRVAAAVQHGGGGAPPDVYGQTLAEESAGCGLDEGPSGAWPAEGAQAGARLYGVQQVERLLRAFQAAVLRAPLSPAPPSAGVGFSRRTAADVVDAASAVVSEHAREWLGECVDRLFGRLRYVLDRMHPMVVDRVRADSTRNLGRSTPDGFPVAELMTEFPHFVAQVHQWNDEFVDSLIANGRAKCLDEVRCTQRLVWLDVDRVALHALAQKALVHPSEFERGVLDLCEAQWALVRAHAARQILLKCHEHVLVPLETRYPGFLQARLARLPDPDLHELFAVSAVQARLAMAVARFDRILDVNARHRSEFLSALSSFSNLFLGA